MVPSRLRRQDIAFAFPTMSFQQKYAMRLDKRAVFKKDGGMRPVVTERLIVIG